MQDVLGHPNTRVMVSHCGYHSVYEAMYHAVPVVGVPFQFEQVRHNLLLVVIACMTHWKRVSAVSSVWVGHAAALLDSP